VPGAGLLGDDRGSGTSCTLAAHDLAEVAVTTSAPSIFDSSRSRCAEKSTSSSKPPVDSASTTLS
jgi:hypothetical protein